MLQVNGYLDPADFPGLQGKPWCPLVLGLEFLGCQKPTFSQVTTLSTTPLLISDLACHALPSHMFQPKVVRPSIGQRVPGLHCDNTQASKYILEHASIRAGPDSDVRAAAGRSGWLWNACKLGARDVVLSVQVSVFSSSLGPCSMAWHPCLIAQGLHCTIWLLS